MVPEFYENNTSSRKDESKPYKEYIKLTPQSTRMIIHLTEGFLTPVEDVEQDRQKLVDHLKENYPLQIQIFNHCIDYYQVIELMI
jgi:hypothetical protein